MGVEALDVFLSTISLAGQPLENAVIVSDCGSGNSTIATKLCGGIIVVARHQEVDSIYPSMNGLKIEPLGTYMVIGFRIFLALEISDIIAFHICMCLW